MFKSTLFTTEAGEGLICVRKRPRILWELCLSTTGNYPPHINQSYINSYCLSKEAVILDSGEFRPFLHAVMVINNSFTRLNWHSCQDQSPIHINPIFQWLGFLNRFWYNYTILNPIHEVDHEISLLVLRYTAPPENLSFQSGFLLITLWTFWL